MSVPIDGPLLRRLREERGYSLTNFAKKVHISKSYLSKLEREERSPSPETWMALADALEVSAPFIRKD